MADAHNTAVRKKSAEEELNKTLIDGIGEALSGFLGWVLNIAKPPSQPVKPNNKYVTPKKEMKAFKRNFVKDKTDFLNDRITELKHGHSPKKTNGKKSFNQALVCDP